jgi:hypothetical protein
MHHCNLYYVKNKSHEQVVMKNKNKSQRHQMKPALADAELLPAYVSKPLTEMDINNCL